MSASENATPVEPMDPARKNSDVTETIAEEATVQLDRASEGCYWNDAAFSNGDRVVTGGECYECSFGTWVKIEP